MPLKKTCIEQNSKAYHKIWQINPLADNSTSGNLKAHRQVPKKRCFEKYCSCDQACQFSAS